MVLVRLIRAGLSAYDRVIYYVLTLVLCFVAAALFLNVFFRYVLFRAFPWAEEATLFLLIWTAGLAARPALKNGEFIRITFLEERLKDSHRVLVTVIKMVVLAALIAYLLVVLHSGIDLCRRVQRQTSPMLSLSMAVPYAAIPYGALLMIVTLLEEAGSIASRLWKERRR